MPSVTAYQLNRPTTVVVHEGIHERLQTLDAGTVLIATSAADNLAGMVEAMCNGVTVAVFSRDLEERGQRVELKS